MQLDVRFGRPSLSENESLGRMSTKSSVTMFSLCGVEGGCGDNVADEERPDIDASKDGRRSAVAD